MDSEVTQWHRLRIPSQVELDRRRGFPADRVDPAGMRRWCERTCRGGWLERPAGRSGGTEYLFEQREEAMAFALRWFPFKCG